MVSIYYEDVEILDVSPEFFVSWLSEVCQNEGLSMGDLTLIFCSDQYLLEMNKQHLDHDYYTDIITFDYSQEGVISGDLFISLDRVRENAVDLNQMFHVELNRVVVHGVLHLMGYGDKSPDEISEMRFKEDAALALIVSRET